METKLEKLLLSIITSTLYDKKSGSRIEEILTDYKNGVPYAKTPLSRMEELLLAIIYRTSYDRFSFSRIEEILKSILNKETYKDLPKSKLEDLFLLLKSSGFPQEIEIDDRSILGLCRIGIMKIGKV